MKLIYDESENEDHRSEINNMFTVTIQEAKEKVLRLASLGGCGKTSFRGHSLLILN